MVQVSFTLPMPHDKRAEGAAAQLANKMGIDPALVVHAKAMGPDFTFFVVYGRVNHLVDARQGRGRRARLPAADPQGGQRARSRAALRRRLVVVGGCIGTDAHTVGIDAILNIKGFAGEKGLEYYREIKVVNLGAQVSVPAARRAGPRGEGRRRPGLPGGHPARRAPPQHPGDVGGVPRVLPAPTSGRCWSSAARASTRRWPASSASTGSSPAARRPARSRATSSTSSSTAAGRRPTHEPSSSTDPRRRAHASPTAATCRTPTPTTPATSSTAPTPRACSATWPPRCASAPTATRGCSRRTPTCSSGAPVRAGDVLEVDRRGGRGRAVARAPWTSRVRRGRPRADRDRSRVGRRDARRAGRRDHARPAVVVVPADQRDGPLRRVGCTTRRRQREKPA